MSKAVAKSKERGEECNPAKDSYETDEKSTSTKDHFCREGHEVDFLLLFDLYIGGGAGPERPDDGEQDQCLRQVEICQTRLALEKETTVISVIMPPLHVKEGIITEKVSPVFSESFFWTCFGLVMYIWELMGVTEKLAFQM